MHPWNALDRLANQSTGLVTEAAREMYKSSLYLTAKYALGYRDVNFRTHGNVIRVLEGSQPRKLIVMPRGSLKTSLGVIAYAVWLLMKDPNLRILIDSELYTNSKNNLREIKMHLQGATLSGLFGDWVGDLWNEGEVLIKQRTIIKKEASITCSGIGAQKTSQHYDIIIADDMNSAKNTATKESAEKVIQHYAYYTSLLEPNGTIVVIGTRYSARDLISKIIKDEILIKEDGFL